MINPAPQLQTATASNVAPHGSLMAQLAAREAEIARLNVDIARLQAETSALRVAIERMRVSVSWRMSFPIRIVGRLARRLITRQPVLQRTLPAVLGRLSPIPLAPQPAAPTDPNARYTFNPAPLSDGGTGVISLNILHHLSRAL